MQYIQLIHVESLDDKKKEIFSSLTELHMDKGTNKKERLSRQHTVKCDGADAHRPAPTKRNCLLHLECRPNFKATREIRRFLDCILKR